MKYAIVVSGGKQFKAVEGGTIEVDRLAVEAGDPVSLDQVLLLVEGDSIHVGTPNVNSAAVSATVVDHFKGPKIDVFRYKPKKRIRSKIGHRQQYTRLKIDKIVME
jgi:large subunit ribosomal protein L21